MGVISMNGEAKETSLAAVLGRCPGSRSPTLSVRLAWSDDTHHQGSPTNHLTLESMLPKQPSPSLASAGMECANQ